MHSVKQVTSLILLILSLLVTFFAQTAPAKSVYVITNHGASIIKVYDIQDDQIQYQATAENLPGQGLGAVGLALDPDSQIIFITYEDSDVIDMLNAKTMIYEQNQVTVPGAAGLAGIAFDKIKQKLYVVDRRTNKLFVYLWNPVAKTLTIEGGTYKTLDYLGGWLAHGIALDESTDLLYVTEDTSTIHYYDTNDPNFGHKGSISLNKEAVAVAIDEARGYLYAGDYRFHKYLIKYKLNGDPNDPNTMIEKNIDPSSEGAYVIDLGVDKETGLVYATTFRYGSWGGFGGAIEVYDTSSWTPDANQIISPNDIETNDISGPAGVAVGGLYKPPVFDLVKDDNDVDCAYPWNEIDENYLVYNICYDANGFDDTNVIITDHLTDDVNYFSSEPCGDYNSTWHTVTWDINDISGADSNCLQLTVKVKQTVKPGQKIINLCEMEGDKYYKFTTKETTICCYGGDIIYVDADANGFDNGTSWLDAYEDLQDALLGATNCDCHQIRVAQQTYRPSDINDTSARSISFDLVDNVAIYGGFPPGGGAWTQRNPYVYETILSGDIAEPNNLYDNSYHVVKVVDVNNTVLDGFIITAGKANGSGDDGYGGGIYCKDSNNFALSDCNVSGNSASIGGALYIESSDPNITACIFSDNLANSSGGSIYNKNYSEPNIINCIFKDNTASASGGGMYNYLSSPTLFNCIFTANTSTSGSSCGGGIGNHESSPTLINCTFSGNSSGRHGGGIYNTYYSEPNVINCVFTGNDATNYHGGGIYSEDSALNVTNCIFTGNIAEYYGGGVYNSSSYELNITNCLFTGNTVNLAEDSLGGAMYNYNCSSATVTNCIFSGCTSKHGGGISNTYSGVDFGNCTFSENWANNYGGGMFIQLSDVNVTNCIFWGNVAAVDDEIYKDASSAVNVTYSDVKGGWSGGVENINKDPCFFVVEPWSGSWTEDASYDNSTFQSTLTDANADWSVNELAGKFVNPYYTSQALQFFIVSNNVNTMKVWSDVTDIAGEDDPYYIYDYHLKVESPCIDSGDPNFNSDPNMTDIDGERRVVDGDANGTEIVDMGADEYYWSPADINSDGFVNFFDYAFFASAWQSVPNDPNYNEDCDLEDDNLIDYKDIALFCEAWLWQTAWAKAFPSPYDELWGRSMSMGMGEGFFPSMQAKRAQPELTAADIEEIIKWLEDLWLTDDQVRKMITEEEWLKFTESAIEAAKQLIYN